MRLIRWLANCVLTVLRAFRNALTDDNVGRQPRSVEEMQQRERETALRDLDRIKNWPPEN